MAYVITLNCCKDASCISACPVDCIRPGQSDPTGGGPQMMFIDPGSCIDCGACAWACPADAIFHESQLLPHLQQYRELNAEYFRANPLTPGSMVPAPPRPAVSRGAPRVAIVGAGPAGCYAATELLSIDGVEVEMFERLPMPFGLLRYGVAPDHVRTKSVTRVFEEAFASERFASHLNVEIGSDLTHADLLDHHHAVIYAVGAQGNRTLGIAGENLEGHHPASEFVGWYNGHPDHAESTFDMSSRTAVVIGNGNVAIDVARMLLTHSEELARTDIAQHSIEALARSSIEEVVLLGRRGPRQAACSVGEFLALGHLTDIDVIIDGDDLDTHPDDDVETAAKLAAARDYAARPGTPGNKRIVFRFHTSPIAFSGDDHVQNVHITTAGVSSPTATINTRLVLSAIGYKGQPIDSVPFDAEQGVVPSDGGRVIGTTGAWIPGLYATGWIKRGPRGVIGTNRACAQDTVSKLLDDFDTGRLDRRVADRDSLMTMMKRRGVEPLAWRDWRALDQAELERGAATGRPRAKFVTVDEVLSALR